MTTNDIPSPGQIWEQLTDGKTVFIESTGFESVEYFYIKREESYSTKREHFKKRFKFSHIFQMSNTPKNPAAVALGRLGGRAGTGKAKARKVSSAQARRAVRARWAKVNRCKGCGFVIAAGEDYCAECLCEQDQL